MCRFETMDDERVLGKIQKKYATKVKPSDFGIKQQFRLEPLTTPSKPSKKRPADNMLY